ncbi:MAG: hypothetical protein FWF85_03555 [Clostridiales bacterium]|nr:hypothetical protein [Clostridiales bacterium]
MKNDKIVNAFNSIQPSGEAKNRVFNMISQKQQKKGPLFKAAISLAVAAALVCLVIFGSMLLTPQPDNEFSLKAYAMELQADGSIELHEADFLDRSQYWHFCSDREDENFFISMQLRCEGENIKSVEFTTEDGFFAKQYVKMENGKIVYEDVYIHYIGKNGNVIARYGDDFENVGNKLVLDKNTVTDDLLLFWGQKITDPTIPPKPLQEAMTIQVLATFNNGKTQEDELIIDLSYPNYPREEMDQIYLETIDTTKLVNAFMKEAEKQGFGEVRVNNVELSDSLEGTWYITFDVLPENGTEWLVNQSCDVKLSRIEQLGARFRGDGDEYTVKILKD